MPIDRWGKAPKVVIEFVDAAGGRIELALEVGDAKALARTVSKAARFLS